MKIQQQQGYIKKAKSVTIESAVVVISPVEQAPWPIVYLCLPPSTKLKTMGNKTVIIKLREIESRKIQMILLIVVSTWLYDCFKLTVASLLL